MTVDDLGIPANATIRQEYVMCGDPDCQNQAMLLVTLAKT
jgi:hypothetical protein